LEAHISLKVGGALRLRLEAKSFESNDEFGVAGLLGFVELLEFEGFLEFIGFVGLLELSRKSGNKLIASSLELQVICFEFC
jgi:hypothetical protein